MRHTWLGDGLRGRGGGGGAGAGEERGFVGGGGGRMRGLNDGRRGGGEVFAVSSNHPIDQVYNIILIVHSFIHMYIYIGYLSFIYIIVIHNSIHPSIITVWVVCSVCG